VISVLSSAASARTPSIWGTFQDVISTLAQIAGVVEHDWASCGLSALTDDNQIGRSLFPKVYLLRLISDPPLAEGSRVAAMSIWTCLRTLLFTTVMISRPVLLASMRHSAPTPSTSPSIASLFLVTLWNLAFVTSKFGGISAHAVGFEELKQACYLALDIVASSPIESEALLRRTCDIGQSTVEHHPITLAKTSTFFVYAEQLIGVVTEDTLESIVLPTCVK
jgi:hypothetical protein